MNELLYVDRVIVSSDSGNFALKIDCSHNSDRFEPQFRFVNHHRVSTSSSPYLACLKLTSVYCLIYEVNMLLMHDQVEYTSECYESIIVLLRECAWLHLLLHFLFYLNYAVPLIK